MVTLTPYEREFAERVLGVKLSDGFIELTEQDKDALTDAASLEVAENGLFADGSVNSIGSMMESLIDKLT